jgi:hypothetical protein
MKIPAALKLTEQEKLAFAKDLPRGVRLVTGPLSKTEIAELVCIPLDMDPAAYDCWMDAALLN